METKIKPRCRYWSHTKLKKEYKESNKHLDSIPNGSIAPVPFFRYCTLYGEMKRRGFIKNDKEQKS